MASPMSLRSPVTPPYDEDYSQGSPKGMFEPGVRNSPTSSALPVPTMTLSPPASPRAARTSKMPMRLRSNSGLSLHTNEDAFRRYTDYNPDGSPRSPTFGTGLWSSLDGVSTSLRRSFAPPVMEVEPETLPIPDFLGREVFQMILGNTAASQRFFHFAQSRGSGPDVEFLLRIQEYSRSLAQFGKQASAMPTPANLPSAVNKALNADMKQLTNAVLPGLETLFAESTRCVERRIARTIYPAFVKHQLAFSTSAAMAGGARVGSFKYPGLAESFCLADALGPDYPVVAVSDAFVAVTGYPKTEAVSRNCRFLQGSLTDRDAVKRLRDSVAREEESLELVLNYHRDGTPYWNLLFTCPLTDASGKLRYYLGGQVDMSQGVGDYKDLLRILNSGPPPVLDEAKEDASGRESRVSRRMSRAGSRERKQERRTSLRSRDSLHNKGPKKSLFQPFRKHAAAHHNSNNNTENQENAQQQQQQQQHNNVDVVLEQLQTVSTSEERLSLASPIDPAYPAYSRLIVLQHTDGPSGFPPRSSSLPADPNKRKATQLSVAFCSAAALDALGLGLFADSIAHRDIFAVLSELADSPSVTKSFRNTVRERILRDGKSATLDIMLGGGYLARKGSLIGLGGGGGGGGGGRSSRADDADGGSGGGGARRHGRPASRSGFASLVGDAGGKMEKLTSHWTPLKTADERVDWVVVIITPMMK
ncbi:K+-channel erg-like protein [Colletotrichum higginsianum IMI 349063]|uniref:K+-channel erg-like protein n=2 Tax=Colletotrichum higginsianum TaxID=80884 RepID=A0A1B7XS87_COLHI|nr:K+-channel erg-like protein [Colletotrichum higginsianum IMI 349063]OBR02606.1 K+-channel erg-like protein [Colletotrichum higginsianum IMI 349063]TID06687.1 Blue-light-activated histidine kinase 1 [Colletotrichum higginsianum]GJD00576.1 K+-channel erg-like protein [Colletotrichum higginsianum]